MNSTTRAVRHSLRGALPPASRAAVATPVPRGWLIAAAILAAGYTAFLARSLLIPLVLALLLALLLAPAVRGLAALRLPRAVAALLVVGGMVAAIGGALTSLAEPAQHWLRRAPEVAERITQELRAWGRPLQVASEATERAVMQIGQNAGAQQPVPVVVSQPSPMLELAKSAPYVATSVIATVFLIFLLLWRGDQLLRKCLSLLPQFGQRRNFLNGTRELQREFSRYLLIISVINAALGICTALALLPMGMPDPLLWGGVVALLNFAPYVGPALAALILLVVGYAEQAVLSVPALVPAAVYLLLHGCESQLVTPLLTGRRLALDPVVIFVALMVFGWLWGMVGLLIAVPLLTCIRVSAQRLWPGQPWLRLLTHP